MCLCFFKTLPRTQIVMMFRLVAILQLISLLFDPQIKLAKDSQTRRAACESIYDDDPFSALNQILFYADSGKMKWEAAVLLLLLAMHGPPKVCAAMHKAGILDALLALRSVQHCDEVRTSFLFLLHASSRSFGRSRDRQEFHS